MTREAAATEIVISDDQHVALEQIRVWWLAGSRSTLIFGGYAGTGKTTIIAQLARYLPSVRIAYCAFTGKAAQVLRTKLHEHGVVAQRIEMRAGVPVAVDTVTTIHGLIYDREDWYECGCGQHGPDPVPPGLCSRPRLDASGYPIIRGKYPVKDSLRRRIDLIVVDEASMISKSIWDDLRSFGVRILAVGDHGQLPPVDDKFNLMESPDIRLEQVHRQAWGSPIIAMATYVRENGSLPIWEFGPNARKVLPWPRLVQTRDTLTVCGRRATRALLNRGLRAAYGVTGDLPIIGDRVVCLRNNRSARIYNGMVGTVSDVLNVDDADTTELSIRLDGVPEPYHGRAWLPQFGMEDTIQSSVGADLWDFGYAMTVHKAQGSQADQVIVYEEQIGGADYHRRWLYTGITRAVKDVTVIGMSP